jgi:hypothetical protein
MNPTGRLQHKKNLLLAFDAFGTLFYPKEPIHKQYAHFAERYGIEVFKSKVSMKQSFKTAFKEESRAHPNYGKAVGMGAEKWWCNVSVKPAYAPIATACVPMLLVPELSFVPTTRLSSEKILRKRVNYKTRGMPLIFI